MFQLKTFSVPSGFRGKSPIYVQLWWFVYATLFRTSPQFMYAWRRWLLRCFGADIGPGVRVRSSARFVYPWKCSIGSDSWIGDDVVVYSLADIRIGQNTCISQRCYLSAGSHDYTKTSFDYRCAPISIGDSCWLATSTFVGPGVRIHDEIVIGACSVVLKDLLCSAVYAGNPVRLVKERL